ncbi:MAG: hypothetical protein KDJ52_04030 [Anaerolineae bacterium]|nr:hypothetical protein [Anaerolineae bacterium]
MKYPFLLSLIVISAIVSILRFDSFQVGTFYDDAHYIVLAESLATGQGYHLINYPDSQPETNFPPGWPILLAPLTVLFPGNYTILKGLTLAFWLASIPLIYRLLALRIKPPYLQLLMVIIALNHGLITYSVRLMSETAFLFFSLLTLNLFETWLRRHQEQTAYGLLVLVTLLALFTQLIRTVGIALLLAILVYLLIKRYFRPLAVVTVVIVLGLLPQLWLNAQHNGGIISSGYQQQVFGTQSPTEKIAQLWSNIKKYTWQNKIVTNLLIPIFGQNFLVTTLTNLNSISLARRLINIGVLTFILLGIILTWPKFRISDIYVGFYLLGILSFWNPLVATAQARFLVPIIPFLYAYLLNGLLWLIRRIIPARVHHRYSLPMAIILSMLMVFLQLNHNVKDWQSPIRNNINDLSIGTTWINDNAPPDAVVMSRMPVLDYLYARRQTVDYPGENEILDSYLSRHKIDYILISPYIQMPKSNQLDNFTKNKLLPAVQSRDDKFQLVYESPAQGVWVYEVEVAN